MSELDGTYRAKAVAGSEQYGTTSNDHDQIVIDFELIDVGQKVSVFLVFSEKAAPYSIKRLRAAGWTGDDLSNLVGLGSRECEVRVFHEDYQGQTKMKTEIVAGGTVTLKTQLDEKGKKAFGAKFRDLAKSTPKPAASNGIATAAPIAQATGTDSEIPF